MSVGKELIVYTVYKDFHQVFLSRNFTPPLPWIIVTRLKNEVLNGVKFYGPILKIRPRFCCIVVLKYLLYF